MKQLPTHMPCLIFALCVDSLEGGPAVYEHKDQYAVRHWRHLSQDDQNVHVRLCKQLSERSGQCLQWVRHFMFLFCIIRDLFLILNYYEFQIFIIFLLVDELSLIRDECIFDYFMYVCVSIICHLSVIFGCLGVVVFYLRTCHVLINIVVNHPNILTIIILTLFINQSMCAERKKFHLM